MSRPTVIVLGGINGAGKTTSSRQLLANTLNLMTFVNADIIAQGLSGFKPEDVDNEAGRIMLERLHSLADTNADFAFETTLAARSYAGWLKKLGLQGYRIHLFYFWLKSAELAIERVSARVKAGGHYVSDQTIRSRYSRSVWNLFNLYMPVVTTWTVYDNSGESPVFVAEGQNSNLTNCADPERWEALRGVSKHDEYENHF